MRVAPAAHIEINAVVSGPAAGWFLKDAAYAAHPGNKNRNPNQPIVRQLAESGVRFEVCRRELTQRGWPESDLLPQVRIVPSAPQRIIDLQLQGYAYVAF